MGLLRLYGPQLIKFRDAIVRNFSSANLDGLLLNLNRHLNDYTSPTLGMLEMTKVIIKKAEEENWLLELIEAAYQERNNDPDLQSIYNEFQPQIVEMDIDHYEVQLLRGNQALINRKKLRQELRELYCDHTRVLVIDGQRFSGKTYSRQLIAYLADKTEAFKIVLCDLTSLARGAINGEIPPQQLGECIARQMGLSNIPPHGDEQDSTWVMKFCDWMTGQLKDNDTYYWIVIDHFGKVLLKQGTYDLILELATRIHVNLSKLRLVLLEYEDVEHLEAVLLSPISYERIPPVKQDDLADFFIAVYEDRKRRKQVDYTSGDIAYSVASVWGSVDSTKEYWMRDLAKAISNEVRKING